MTVRYVGKGGSDVNDGLSWANRKLTLNGVEDTPVVAGDTVYVGPGIYRESLTTDVSGSSGNVITYIGDVTGANTDGIGGMIRITGSNDDAAYPNARDRLITITHNYRTFRGFYMGQSTYISNSHMVYIDGSTQAVTNIIFEYCYFTMDACSSSTAGGIVFNTPISGNSDFTVRNCIFENISQGTLKIWGISTNYDTSSIIENCLVYGSDDRAFGIGQMYGNTIRGVTGHNTSVPVYTNYQDAGNNNYVHDNFFRMSQTAIEEGVGNTIVEDYNFFCGVLSAGLSEGANSISSYLPVNAPLLRSGYKFPWGKTEIPNYNDNIYMSDTSSLSKDLYGLSRPGSGKRTRGAIQFMGVERDTSEYKVSPSSLKMADASKSITNLPVNAGGKIRVRLSVKREANYAGTAPQLVLQLSTQSEVVVTDTGSTGTWNRLVNSVTPSQEDRWLKIELRSNNTASSGNYAVWFDDIKVQAKDGIIPTMKWVTNEILIFAFPLRDLVDPWIAPTIPVPAGLPVQTQVHKLPSFYKPG